MKKIIVTGIALGLTLSLFGAGDQKIIADFDSGEKPCNLGTDIGSWDKDPKDDSQTCVVEFDDTTRVGSAGYSWRIDYDVDSPNPAFNGVWIKLGKLDLTSWDYLSLSVKGDKQNGYTERFKVELKAGGQTGTHYVTGITDKWRKIRIPLAAFGLTNLQKATELILVFEDNAATTRKGTIYVDNISLEKKKKQAKKF